MLGCCSVGKIGGNQHNPDRRPNDAYPTSPGHTRAVVPYLPSGLLWECAAGDGAMLDVLAETHEVYGTDVSPGRRDVRRADFLTAEPVPGTVGVVTNPPYSLASQFVERGFELGLPFAFLFPVNYLGGQARFQVFTKRPPAHVVVVSSRMHLEGVGASQFNHAWFIWAGRARTTKLHWAP